jgi:nitroimidazol reductase NimA-like FMN-containing flavoprotein (pyridoxamine 5'-phosphate oxidase superfamily)
LKRYHLRRKDKAMKSRAAMLDFLESQEAVTVALSKDDEPYLFTADYGFDRRTMSIFIHCARKGKKIDYITENPVVWGQVMEDLGYVQGDCDHKYRTVQFRGKATLITDMDEKRKALSVMIDQLEDDPDEGKREFIKGGKFRSVLIIKIKIEELSGKESLAGDGE